MAKIDTPILDGLKKINPERLIRDELGVNFSFEASNETIKSFQDFLLEIANKSADKLTDQEVSLYQRRASAFINICNEIRNFDTQKQGIERKSQIVQSLETEWQQARNELRAVFNFLQIDSVNLQVREKEINDLLSSLRSTQDRATKLIDAFSTIPGQKKEEYNQLFQDIQTRLNQEVSRYTSDLNGHITNYESRLKAKEQEISLVSKEFRKEINEIEATVKDKLSAVEQQARKFSAEKALTTYSKIYEDEAKDVNKPAIFKWEWILVLLVFVEIMAAIGMFYFFKSEIEFANTPLMVSIIFVKVFILSSIAILISYAVKNLNAQNHLYATNKFKANSLSSFQAFIEATSDNKLIDQIIQHVSIAVYSQNISGYLSKDDSGNITQKDILDLASKISLGKKSE